MRVEFLFLYLLVTLIDAYRIFAVFPIPSVNNQRVFNQFTSKLCNHGHEVVVITPNAQEYDKSVNISVIDVEDETEEVITKYQDEGKIKEKEITLEIANEIFKAHYKSRKVQDLINNDEKFDLLLVDGQFPSSLALTQVFDLPVVMINAQPETSNKIHQTFGIMKHPLLSETSNWNIMQIMFSTLNLLPLRNHEEQSKKVLRELFGKNTPPFEALYHKVELALHNDNTVWESNKPKTIGVINLRRIDIQPKQNVTEYLATYLDSAENGVIISNIDAESLTPEQVSVLIDVMAKLPYNFLLKWPSDSVKNTPKNVKLYEWSPLEDVLRHKNVKAFISRGDPSSVSESLEAGVPLIVVPMTSDESSNADLIVKYDAGIKIDQGFLKGLLEDAISSVILHERYRTNAIEMGKIIADQPKTVEEQAVWWTEYVVRHQGTSHLRSPTANITWSEYLVLDVLSIVFGIFLGILVILGAMVTVLIIKFRSPRRKQSRYEDFWTVLPTHTKARL